MRTTLLTAALAPILLTAWACAPADDSSGDDRADDPASTPAADTCTTVPDQQGLTLEDGTLTVATDSPAFEPWFSDDDPTNGKGYESAVAYAVAGAMGFTKDQVTWVKVPFNTSYAPGKKDFDFDINQIPSLPPGRRSSTSPTATTRPRRRSSPSRRARGPRPPPWRT